ncbi:MAG TPA: energy transducer TonB [Burkholderiaceae bacterium]|jgi:TonB family protein
MQHRGLDNKLRMVACLSMVIACSSHVARGAADSIGERAAILDVNQCRPVYPRAAMQRGEHGVVKMQFTIGANGKLVGSAIVKSSGFRDLDQAALNALIHCRFKPAYRNERPEQSAFVMEYRWDLQ